jgi:hypothetical protein
VNTGIETTYTGRSTNWPMIWISTALAVPFLLTARGSGGSTTSLGFVVPVLVMLGAVAVNLITASSVRLLAGPNGVVVRFGVFGWPRFRYSIDRIALAEATEVSALSAGRFVHWFSAWGIRWSPRFGLMLTLRGGPALRLVLTNGRRIVISTPQPELAVRSIESARLLSSH